MGAWKRSKELSDKTWSLIREEPSLAAFPVKGAVYGVAVALLGIVPGTAVMVGLGNAAGLIAGGLLIVLGSIAGLTVSMIQLGALVMAADALLAGRTISRQECVAEARKHTSALAGWSAISVVMGLLLNAAQGDGGGGVAVGIVRAVFAGLLAAAWTLLTFFVLPVIVLEGLGPITAIKRSGSLIKARWGETISGGFRIGVRIALLLILPGVVLLIAGIVLAVALDNVAAFAGGGLLVVAGVGLVLAGAVVQAAARNVFGVVMYRFATGSAELGPFTEAELQGAVTSR